MDRSEAVFNALDPIWTLKPETASRLRGRIAAVLDSARGPDDTRANPAAWSGWLKMKLGSPKLLGKIDRSSGKRVDRNHFRALPYKDMPTLIAKLRDDGSVPRSVSNSCFVCITQQGGPFREVGRG